MVFFGHTFLQKSSINFMHNFAYLCIEYLYIFMYIYARPKLCEKQTQFRIVSKTDTIYI